ncbi:hypothetical protein BDB01DRAFT_775562 [Pilobolus umbonatus]|nr:hypothetical protein BDB01DRAFT_775562 [Pilobolus umbonatus]
MPLIHFGTRIDVFEWVFHSYSDFRFKKITSLEINCKLKYDQSEERPILETFPRYTL